MPQFDIKLDDGRSIRVEGERPPTNDEASQIIQSQFGGGQQAQEQPQQQQAQSKGSAVGAFGRAAATGVAPAAAGAGGFWAGATAIAPIAAATGPFAPVTELVGGAIGAGLASYGASKAQQAIIHKAAPAFEQQEAQDVQEHPIATGAGRIASAAPVFAINPGQSVRGLAAIPAVLKGTATALQRKALAATAVQAGVQGGMTAAQTGITEGRLPTGGEMAEAGISALIYGNPRIKALLPRSVAAAEAATGRKPDAIPIRSAETPVVGETPGNRPPLGEGVSQPEEPAQAQAPQAPGAAQQPVLRLSAEDQAHIDAERGSVDVPVEIVDKPSSANEPFGYGRASSINRDKGTIEIYPEFANVLNEDMKDATPEQKRLAIRSTLAEERNHLATAPEHADAYWDTLTSAEQAIERRLYTGKYGAHPEISARDMGYEAIRRRFQRLARMDSTEVARLAGKERWKLQSLEALNDAIRGIRETLGTKASKEGLAILDKVQGNLDAARAAVGGQPASLRRKMSEDEAKDVISRYNEKKVEASKDTAAVMRDTYARGLIGDDQERLDRIASETTEKSKNLPTNDEIAEYVQARKVLEDAGLRVEEAKTVPTGEPASLRRKKPDEGQQEFFLPPIKEAVERPGATDVGAKPLETPRYLTPDKVHWEGPRKEAAFRRITDAEAKDPAALAEILPQGASEGGSDRARSNTHNVTALFDRYTGRIDVVSTYKGTRGEVRMGDPSSLSSDAARPHRQFDQLLDRYTPIYSISLKEPVQNFHERFASMQDFQEKFGNAATEEASNRLSATQGETVTPSKKASLGGQAGTGKARAFQAEQFALPVEVGPVEPPATAEAGAIHDFFQGKKPASAEETRDMMIHGAKRATSQMVSALKRMMEREQAKNPDLSAEEALQKSVESIYEDLNQTKDRSGYVAKSLARFDEPLPQQNKPAAAEQAGTPQGTKGVEVTRPPGQEPASLRRKVRDAKDATLAEADRIYTGVKSLITRRDISDAIPKSLDAAETVANNVGREFENNVRLSAGATGKTRRGDMKLLTSANPMRDSGAVIGRFKMSDLTPEAQAKFQTLFNDYLAKHPAGNPIATRIDALRSATTQLINDGDLRADRLTYSFNDQAKAQLPTFMNQVDTAAANARAAIKNAGWFERRILTKKLRFLQKLRGEIVEADRSWNNPKLRETAIAAQREFDQIFQRGVDFGSKLHYDPDYAPGRYEGEFISEGKILFPGMNVLGGRWKSPKVFKNIYEAVNAGPYMSITRDIASMVGHRARQEERAIGRQQWVESFKNLTDPDSGLPVGADPKKDANGNPQPPSSDYEIVYPFRNKAIAVHRGWSRLVRTLTGESKVTEFAPARVLLELEQRLKHTLLVGDFFHLGRLSYYAASIMGRKAGFRGGLAAIDFREADLPRAVKQGLVSKEAADWVTERIPVKIGGKDVMFSRRQIADGFQRQGLNVGQIQDALYKDLTGKVPLVGPYNKWLFDSYTRGLMMESAVKEFERLNKANPGIDSSSLMRDIARDTNRFYGSIGRQGWFKSKTWQDISRLAFLAPQWVEGLVMKEAGTYKRAAYAGTGLRALGVTGGREGLPAMGTLGRGIARGMLTMLAVTQAINLITRGKPTWMNDEEGHKFDAWIPGGEHGFFLNPLSVFNELSHDLWRYGETKPKAWDAVNQIGQNKLSPFGRLMFVLHDSKSPTGEYQTTTTGVLGKAAEQLTPAPISFGKVARAVGHAVAPGTIAPNPPGALQRQSMQWAGLKAEPGASASQRVSRMADRFKQANGIGQTGFQFETTDQPSYVKLRTALRNGDDAAATKIMGQIGKTPTEIGKAMKLWSARPWTGSKKADRAFFATLTDKELELVSQAQLERQATLEKFYDLLLSGH